jgi:16S rRNA (guanine966-N2)-methyltransferase
VADAGRVVAGTARGIRLAAAGPGTRALGDRVKETLFAILEPDLPGAAFLDLFAGSGAAGIEALSRGAERAVFVERDAKAVGTIAANLRSTHLEDRAEVIRADVGRFLAAPSGGPFAIVVVDPPYAEVEVLVRTLERLGGREAPLVDGARVVAKHFWRATPPAGIGLLASERERRFGETALTFYRRRESDTGRPAGPAAAADRGDAR